jgi:hypothetical protein
MFVEKVAHRLRVRSPKPRLWDVLCSRRSFISKMLEEGKLREINVFGPEHADVQSAEFEAAMEAYSYSHFVHIPVNRLPLNQLDTISSETVEKMLATSLLCNYGGASTSLAREVCRRRKASFNMHTYGHCMLAFYAEDQWEDMRQNTSADDLFDYLQYEMMDELLIRNPLVMQVVSAVLKTWIHHTADIEELVRFLDLLLATDIHMESIMIGPPDILYETILFLRHHGHYDRSHRLLSLLQHNLQRKIFYPRGDGCQFQSESEINRGINDLIAFSTCLQDKEDMKYLSGVFEFYLKNIFPVRASCSNRLIDVENILQSILNPNRQHFQTIQDNSLLVNAKKEKEKNFRNQACAERALVGYKFFRQLQHRQKGRGLHSSKMCTQV